MESMISLILKEKRIPAVADETRGMRAQGFVKVLAWRDEFGIGIGIGSRNRHRYSRGAKPKAIAIPMPIPDFSVHCFLFGVEG
jgi:hypothetical protein